MRAALLSGVLALTLLTGCQAPPPAETTIFAMDTVMSLTIHGEEGAEVMADCVSAIYALEDQLSVTDETAPLARVNGGEDVALPAETVDLLERTLDLCAATGGALDITAYPALTAWGFQGEEQRVPDDQELARLAAGIDYAALTLEEDRLLLPEGMAVDLGAVAKGHAADVLVDILDEYNITSALLNLGQSSIQAVGAKADGSPWNVGIVDPDTGGALGILQVMDAGVGTSGGYQRYFDRDGQRYWHILDPDTAAPARSGLAAVSVVSPSGLVCDGLSTALFVMGLEEGVQLWRDHPELDFEAIFITDEDNVVLTPGLEGAFTLAPGYEDRRVEVVS